MTKAAVIGMDLGGTKLAAALFSPTGKILQKIVVPLNGRGGRAVGLLIRETLGTLLDGARRKKIAVYSIGVSVPGISNSKSGLVWAPNISGWKNYPLHRELLSGVRKTGITVTIDSDRACYILGEVWRGVAKGCRDAIFVAVGTGIGAGILVDGKILRGAHDIGGAIGWLALDRPFRREYISCGCFEHHASGEGLAKVARHLSKIRPSKGNNSKSEDWTAHDVFTQYERGDATARQVLAEAVEFWGMAVANLVSLFNPEKIIFGGGVFGPAAKFLEEIRAEAKKWAQPIAMKQVKLHASTLGGDAGLYGAGSLALTAVKPPLN